MNDPTTELMKKALIYRGVQAGAAQTLATANAEAARAVVKAAARGGVRSGMDALEAFVETLLP